jgi:hypothetical protein
VSRRLAALALAVAFAAIYLPDLGHGFVRDDFGWIESSRIESPSDLLGVFTHQPGFYRPLVSLTFSADYALWGLDPHGYAATNVVLFALVAGLIYRLARTLELPPAAAVLAAALWAFDIHAPRMALLWISGRTALMLCIFALATADAVFRGRDKTAGVLCLLALLTKEEAALLPAIMTVFVWRDGRARAEPAQPRLTRVISRVSKSWPMWAALAVYAVLRLNSGAFGPGNLPAYYPVTADARAFIRNLGEYAVRAGLISSIAALVITLAVRPPVPLQSSERRVIVFGALWIAGFFALTIFAANRSDLYALTPSIGFALAAAALASCALRGNARRFRVACVGLTVAVFALIPVYWQRDARWVAPADVSASVIRTLAAEPPSTARRIVLLDDVPMRYGLESGFGTLLPEAVHLFKGPEWSAELRRSGEDCRTASRDAATTVFAFRGGQLTRCW